MNEMQLGKGAVKNVGETKLGKLELSHHNWAPVDMET